jgi:hypothetical protein
VKVVIFLEETRKISFEMQKRALRRAKIFSYGIGTAGDHGGCTAVRAKKEGKATAWAHNQIKQTQAARALP